MRDEIANNTMMSSSSDGDDALIIICCSLCVEKDRAPQMMCLCVSE